MNTWLKPVEEKYGGSLAGPARATADATATTTVAPVATPRLSGFTSTSEPLLWFGVVAALGVGLMAYSTAVPA
ncbi:MAG: hypothetical protein QM714_12440 [Nocardioides sp.]|uniref:hypothetical protein n=1 Tax=Nocardioides sp. TaxID=35761 RepID=UPI0039E4F159